MRFALLVLLSLIIVPPPSLFGQAAPLRIALFEAEATPPLGTPLQYMPGEHLDDSLRVRGVVLLGDEAPIVLAAIDWIGIGNGGHEAWRMALAEAAGTSPDRVAVQTLHQHDAPATDFDAALLLLAHGIEDQGIDDDFAHETIRRTAAAVRAALEHPQEVTHLGLGKARVDSVASNRRLYGPDGTVQYGRMSNTRNRPALRELPEDQIDPYAQVISFWNGERPLAVMSYYATHPQSYYLEGGISSDFVGIARDMRQAESGVFHVHFNGAGGNIAAGKYNDGSHAMRPVLARRLAEGLAQAWAATEKQPVTGTDVGWDVYPVLLPVAIREEGRILSEQELMEQYLQEPDYGLARDVAWQRRVEHGVPILLTALRLGGARVLHMPGELFIEYQLAAQSMRPDLFVAMAAYGDYGPGYIGTRVSYEKGGYEVGPPSRVAPEAEAVLTEGMRALLDAAPDAGQEPSAFTRQKPRYEPPAEEQP